MKLGMTFLDAGHIYWHYTAKNKEIDIYLVFMRTRQVCEQYNLLQVELLEVQRQQLKHENREYKIRENRNLSDYAELEEENISLQKTVSQLKISQVSSEVY